MKKKFVSILLVVAMMAAMIPAMTITASAFGNTVYDTVVTDQEILIDGLCDSIYKESTKITNVGDKYLDKPNGNERGEFEAYTAASKEGLYIWIQVQDETMYDADEADKNANSGDMVQFYFNWGDRPGSTTKKSNICIDYNGVVRDYFSQQPEFKWAVTKGTSNWTAELYLPWTHYPEFAINNLDREFYCGFGIQVADCTDGDNNRDAILFDQDKNKGLSYWSNYALLGSLNLKFSEKTRTQNVAYHSTEELAVDGVIDDAYLLGTKVAIQTPWSARAKDAFGDGYAYYAYTDEAFYIVVDIHDETVGSDYNDWFNVYLDFTNNEDPYLDDANYKNGSNLTTKVLGRVAIDPLATKFDNRYSFANSAYTSGKYAITKASTVTENGYVLEMRIPWTDTIKEAIAKTENYTVGAGIEIKDDNDKGLYDQNDKLLTSASNDRDSIYYDSYLAGNAWSYYNVVSDIVLKKFGTISSIDVALDKDITLNYYSTLPVDKVDSTEMRFTVGNDSYVVPGEYNSVNKEFVYKFNGIAPQNMGDNIKAELIVNGAVVSSKDEYSVLEYCNNLLSKTPAELGQTENQYAAMQRLIYDMLEYGAQAQLYTGHNTKNLVNKGFEGMASDAAPVAGSGINATEALPGYGMEIIGVTTYFDSVNRVAFIFKANDISKVVVNISDGKTGNVAVDYPIYDLGDNTYAVIANPVDATEFDNVYTMRLIYQGSEWSKTIIQSVSYDLNSYFAAIMETSEDQGMKDLAKAAYNYGLSAIAYEAA